MITPEEIKARDERDWNLIGEGIRAGLPDVLRMKPKIHHYEAKWLKYFCVQRHEIQESRGPLMYHITTPAGRCGSGTTIIEALVNVAKSNPA